MPSAEIWARVALAAFFLHAPYDFGDKTFFADFELVDRFPVVVVDSVEDEVGGKVDGVSPLLGGLVPVYRHVYQVSCISLIGSP